MLERLLLSVLRWLHRDDPPCSPRPQALSDERFGSLNLTFDSLPGLIGLEGVELLYPVVDLERRTLLLIIKQNGTPSYLGQPLSGLSKVVEGQEPPHVYIR